MNIIHPLSLMARALSNGEAYSNFIASKDGISFFSNAFQNTLSPLYYSILHYWIQIFGNSEIALRSLSLISFAVFIFVSHHIITEFFKLTGKKGYGALLFFVVNPLFLYYAFTALPYMLLITFVAISYYFLLKKNYRLYVIFAIFAGLSHMGFLIFAVIQALHSYIYDKKQFNVYLKSFLPQYQSRRNHRDGTGFRLKMIPWTLVRGVSLFFTIFGILFIIATNTFSLFIHTLPIIFLIICSFLISLGMLFLYKTKRVSYKKIIIGLLIFCHFALLYGMMHQAKQSMRIDFKSAQLTIRSHDIVYIENEDVYFQALYYYGSSVFIYKQYETTEKKDPNIPSFKYMSELPIYPKKAFILKSDGFVEARTIY